MELNEIYSNEVTKLINFTKDFKYEKCGEISNFLAYASLIAQSKISLFLSEFLLYIFENLEYAEIEYESKESKDVNKEIIKFLEELKKIDVTKNENKAKIVDLMIEIRYKISQFQVNTARSDRSILK